MAFPPAFAAILISLLPVLSVSLLAGVAMAVLLIGRFYPNRRFLWRFSFICATISWICTLISGYGMPIFLQAPIPEGGVPLAVRPAFIVDSSSWPLAMALLTLLVAIFLRELGEIEEISPVVWSGMLALAAGALAAIYAATPVTLMLGWAALDLLESIVVLSRIDTADLRRQYILTVAFRTMSIWVVLWASAVFTSAEYDLTMLGYVPEMNVFLLAAAVLRLGIFPFHDPYFTEDGLRRELGTFIRMTNVIAALILICRLAGSNFPEAALPGLLGAAALAALIGALNWWGAPNEIDGRPSWILGLAAFSIAGALLSMPLASLTWGLILVLCGSLLFLTERSGRRGMVFPLGALILCSGLPFTPAWPGMEIFTWDLEGGWVHAAALAGLMLAFIIILAGYYRLARRTRRAAENNEHAGKIALENLTAFFVLAVYIGLGVWFTMNAARSPWLPGGIAAAGTLVFILLQQRVTKGRASSVPAVIETKTIPLEEKALILVEEPKSTPRMIKMISSIQALVSLKWLYLFLYRFFDFFRSVFRMAASILEGEGGLLWALLIFILLITFMFQPAGGM